MAELILDVANFVNIIREHNSFVLTTHVNPDGDALGSEVGLAEWLLSIGKEVHVINHSPTPYNYHFLDTGRPILQQFDEQKHAALIRNVDAILVLDVNDPDRVRSLGPFVTNAAQYVGVIDHHLNPKPFAKDYFIDTDASSTGELIMRLVTEAMPELGGSISQKAATALYVAIMTDSGSFRFPRTDADLLRMCAHLLDLGADPVQSYNEVYNTSPAGRLLLLRDALNSLEYHYDSRMAFQCITQANLVSAGAEEEDVDGFVQMPFQVRGIVFSVFLLELKEGWKISTRSKDPVSAALFAQQFGGNGHFNAAGARVHGEISYKEIHKRIVDNAAKILDHAGLLKVQAA
jgi:bifunctional oligoribonuclease and PAP phosphatase NrnA